MSKTFKLAGPPELNLDPPLLQALGEVVAYFALLESQLASVVWLLTCGNNIDEQRVGQIITANLEFRRMVELFGALVRHRLQPPPEPELTDLCSKLNRVAEQRNGILHSQWIGRGPQEPAVRIKPRTAAKGYSPGIAMMSPQDLLVVVQEIRQVTQSLMEFALSHGFRDLGTTPQGKRWFAP